MLFFGTEQFSADILQGLLDHGFTIDAVVTKPDTPSGRGQKVASPAVKVIAERNAIPVLQPNRLVDIADDIRTFGTPAAVLASYGKIIPQSILDLFEPGIINVHPSLLPKYRGASPIESAILNGDTETGVSIMKLVADMDAGPVYVQQKIALHGNENAEDVYNALAQVGIELLAQYLPAMLDESLHPQPQQGEPVYCSMIKKQDGVLDFRKSAVTLERQVRAYHKWPQSRTTLHATEVIITKAHAVQTVDDAIYTIPTGAGYLAIDALKPVGKKEMPIQAFLQGYRSTLS